MNNVIVISTHISGIKFLENLLKSFKGYIKYPILIVINEYKKREFNQFLEIQNKFKELPITIEKINTNSFEFGAIYTAYNKTSYKNILLLSHSCEIVNPHLFDIVFNEYKERSIAFSLNKRGWNSSIGKYKRDILKKMNLKKYLPLNMWEGLDTEINFTIDYHKLDKKTLILFEKWIDCNKFKEKFGRLRMKIANKYIIRYKSHWNNNMVIEEIKKKNAIFSNRPLTKSILQNLNNINYCVWFGEFNRLLKTLGKEDALNFMYKFTKKINRMLFFETSLQEEMEEMGIRDIEGIKNFLINNTCFTKIELSKYQQGKNSKKLIFECTKPLLNFKGETSKVSRISKNKIMKSYFNKNSNYSNLLRCKKYEVNALKKLDSIHFPKLIEDVNDSKIIIEYSGIPLTKKNLPNNYNEQIKEILLKLNNKKIVHRDIKPDNLLVKDGIIKLIDFGWATEKGNELKDAPSPIGGNFKVKGGFDDEYSLRKSIAHIIKNY
ncbi:MAG: hypothetical protein V3V78_01745 [Candidatus Woesearchaeota archaeon]